MSDIDANKKKETHPMLILLVVVILCAIATYIIPAGTYNTTLDEEIGSEIIDVSSFKFIHRTPADFGDLCMSFTLGLQNASALIFFLLIIGGMFGIVNGTGALNLSLANIMKKIKGREYLMIPIIMLLLGCGSTFCGNFEEFLVFVPLILACCITAGYDSLTAVGIIFFAASAGYGGGITNAFTVGKAQEIAGLPTFSGMSLRITLFLTLEAISFLYVIWYAHMIKKNPKLSGAYIYDQEYNQNKNLNLNNIPALSVRQAAVILVFIVGMVLAAIGVVIEGYYVDELSAIFLVVGGLCGLLGKLSPSEICKKFVRGSRDMLLPCFMIGLANGAVILLQDANVLDTVLHYASELLALLPSYLMAWGMFIFHLLFNVIVPSGSVQATATMPVMVPLADSAGITRQTAVLAYQLGDAFTNVLAPTGGEILAALAICRVPFGKWVRFLLPLFLMWVIIAFIFLIYAVNIGYGPF